MLSKLLRHGNSQAVIIPAKFLRKLSIKKGEKVELRFEFDKAQIVLTFPEARQLSLEVGRAVRSPRQRNKEK